jgi:hypothetical protein
VAWFLWGSGRRYSGAVLALLVLAGCVAPPRAPAEPAVTAPTTAPAAQPITAVLAAGDASIGAFDNAIDYLHDMLETRAVRGSSTRLLSARRQRPADEELSVEPTLAARIEAMKPPPGGSCLVYLTSHGAFQRGFYLAVTRTGFMPAELDRALEVGCGTAPTVVVVSACFSGQFAVPPMARPNRIILTAARADRTSFGCGAGYTYTYFDECLIGALPGAADWREVYARASGCVGQRERQIGVDASEPQAFFGDDVRNLAAPLPPGSPAAIQFAAAPIPYRPALVPIDRGERERQFDELKAYGEIPAPKALALTPAGFFSIAASDRAQPLTEDDAARLALQRCEFASGGACILFARDNAMINFLPSGQAPFHPLTLMRSGAVDPASTPFIRDDQRPAIAQYLAMPEPKALALSPGHAEIGIGSGATIEAARQAALDHCEAGERDCLLYAEGERIVLGWR